MQFVNPLFLIALSALAIPVLIHLFNFRQFKKVYFTNVNFLREIQQETKKQSRLRQLLILLTRLLAIASLVFAFAQPYIPASENQKKMTGRRSVSVYIDNSASMEALATEGRLIDIAKTKAREIASAYAPSDQFQLLTNDFEGRMQQFTDQEQFLSMVDEVQISPVSRELQAVVSRQNDMRSVSGNLNMDAYLVSDFQKTTSSLLTCTPDTSARWFLVPVTAAKTANLFIDTVFFNSPVHQPGQPVRLTAQIRNISPEPLEKIPVKLSVNGVQKAISNFSIGAGSIAQVTLTYTENEQGTQNGLLEITDYPVVYDDKFYFSYNILPSIPVISIDEQEADPYLRALFSDDSTVTFTRTGIRQVDYGNLFRQSLIILNGPQDISSGLAQELLRFTRKGGTLALFPSPKNPAGLLPVLGPAGYNSLTGPDTSRMRIGYLDTESELYTDVFERNSAGKVILPDNADLPMVYKHFRFRAPIPAVSEALMKLQNNQPFLEKIPLDRGQIFLFSAPLDPDWTDFPKHTLFVPTLYKIALLSNPSHPLYYTAGVNSIIDLPMDSIPGSQVFKLKQLNSSYEVIPEIRKSGTDLSLMTHDQIKSGGFYSVTAENRTIAGLAFNHDRRESDLVCYTRDELLDQAKRFPGTEIKILTERRNTLVRQIHQFNQGTPLWKLFIILALVFIAAEIAIIRLFKG